MNKWYLRVRYYSLALAASGLFALSGCGLSDQQWASVWQSIITTGLSTIVGNAVTAAVSTGG